MVVCRMACHHNLPVVDCTHNSDAWNMRTLHWKVQILLLIEHFCQTFVIIINFFFFCIAIHNNILYAMYFEKPVMFYKNKTIVRIWILRICSRKSSVNVNSYYKNVHILQNNGHTTKFFLWKTVITLIILLCFIWLFYDNTNFLILLWFIIL